MLNVPRSQLQVIFRDKDAPEIKLQVMDMYLNLSYIMTKQALPRALPETIWNAHVKTMDVLTYPMPDGEMESYFNISVSLLKFATDDDELKE